MTSDDVIIFLDLERRAIVAEDQSWIKCLKCNMTSYNSNDVAALYCGHCHRFHQEGRRETIDEKRIEAFFNPQSVHYLNRDARQYILYLRAKLLRPELGEPK